MESLTGSVERVTFFNPENEYSVIRIKPDKKNTPGISHEGLVTVTGNLPELSPGQHLRLGGRWVNHPKHGLQFLAEVCEQIMPATSAGIRRYLESGLIKGIGLHLADRIVAHFGVDTLEVIEKQPERLQEVPDIGPKRSRLIAAAWEEQKQVQEIMLFLHGYGVSTSLAVKIFKHYGEQSMAVVQSDPYRLAQDIHGVGFKTADKLAQSLGLPPDHPSRIGAGVVYTLNQAANEGHVYLPGEELVDQVGELLAVPVETIEPAVRRLAQAEIVVREALPFESSTRPHKDGSTIQAGAAKAAGAYGAPAVYLAPLHRCETGLAERLRELSSAWPTRLSELPPAFVELDTALSADQQAAIRTALSQPVSVLTGGPGTGKTTALKALVAALERAGKTYALASPTGRAAKRLSQAAGRPASTIHRLLGYSPGEGFKHGSGNPLPVDLLVVDEVSMLDLVLAYNLLKALPAGAHLLLVGDVDQLPSVGAGDVLRDVIASRIAPVTRLKVIFRQAAGSQIITNAHRINRGEMPLFSAGGRAASRGPGDPMGDFFLFPAETPEEAARWVQEVVHQRIPQRFGFHPSSEIQVLSPMYRGPAGVNELNSRLQASLNPLGAGKPETRLFGQVFRQGDKLMQLQNNYEKDVYNGDIGVLFGIDPVEQRLTLDFEGRAVDYGWSDSDQLTLAYAITVHKAQGSEFPAVVIPLVTQHYLMLQRNLLYTAVTRAKELCVLVGSKKAIAIALRNDRVAMRYTALDWRLRDEITY